MASSSVPDAAPVTGIGLLRIDHVGIAVPDLDAAIEFYARAFGMRCVHREENQEQGVREAMLAGGYGSSTTNPAGVPPARASTSSTPRTPAACSSSWWNRRVSFTTECSVHNYR